MDSYQDFLSKKKQKDFEHGFTGCHIPEGLFDFQRVIVEWALKKGRACVFADTGLGKTMIQSAWAYCVHQHTGNRVLIVAPLCVAQQTVVEASKIGVTVRFQRTFDENKDTGIIITNYEMLEKFEDGIRSGFFDGIVLDESSILKHETSKTRAYLIDLAGGIPYRLSCTATPSPNDFMELGSQSEFIGVMRSVEMLAQFFVHDSGETSKWRLKGHGKSKFWEWLSTWAVFIKKPSDLGFSDVGYDLPPLMIKHVEIGEAPVEESEDSGISERSRIRRETVDERVAACADLVNASTGSFLVWCHRNDESEKLKALIDGSEDVSGADSIEAKEKKITAFQNGQTRVLITKPKIAGFGLNWQHCNQVAFVGLSDSYEQVYQAIRRCWRFGQTNPVDVFFIAHKAEGPVLENIQRKELQAEEMSRAMILHMRDFQKREVFKTKYESATHATMETNGNGWRMILGDCVDVASSLGDQSIDYSIFSPPFSSLYTYSNSERDLGNSRTHDEFFQHFDFLIQNLFRILRDGRNISVHCMNLPTSKTRHGYIGIYDFRGEIIRRFQNAGFIYHSEVCIWKDPVVAMQRTKALGLLWKQIKKDSSMSRQGIPDYVVTFRKPGVNTKPISHTAEEFPVDLWQHYASPCWFDIRQSNTLNGRHATEDEDERHIAPLQLDVIERCIDLWSAKGDLIYSPFAGIGSEGFVAIQKGRLFTGSELKKSYFDFACKNLTVAEGLHWDQFKVTGNPRELAVNFHKKDKISDIETEKQMSIYELIEAQTSQEV